jgi:hypothetical protein
MGRHGPPSLSTTPAAPPTPGATQDNSPNTTASRPHVPICAGHPLDRPSITTPTQIATPIPTASQSGSEVAEYRATPTPTPSAVAAPYVVPLLRFFPSSGLSLLLSLSMCSPAFHGWERRTYHSRPHARRGRITGNMYGLLGGAYVPLWAYRNNALGRQVILGDDVGGMGIVEHKWSFAAEELGLDLTSTRSKILRDFKGVMSGTIDGFPVEVRSDTSRGETGKNCTTKFAVGLTGFQGRHTLTMRPANQRFRGWRLFGSPWVTFDDPEFDSQFAVQCKDPELLRLHLDASRRQRIREFTDEYPDWRIVKGQVVSQRNSIVDKASILIETVESHVAVAHAVCDV